MIDNSEKYKEITGKLVKYCSSVMIPFHNEAWDFEIEKLVCVLTHYVYSLGEIKKEVVFDVPETWIDHLLLDLKSNTNLLGKIIRKYIQHRPIKLKKLSRIVTASALLPDIPPRIGDHNIRFMIKID